jgi:hypothetical protein
MAELKQYELIKTIIYKVDTRNDYAEYKLEVYKGNNGFKGIIYRKDCYRMLARYDGNFIGIDKNESIQNSVSFRLTRCKKGNDTEY